MTTLKQKRFVKEYFKNQGNATEAVVRSYVVKNRHVARVYGTNLLKKKGVKEEIEKILKKEGLTDKDMAIGMKKIVDAAISKRALKYARPKDALAVFDMKMRLEDKYPSKKIDKRVAKLELSADYGKMQEMSSEELISVLEKLNNNLDDIKKEILVLDEHEVAALQ